MGCAASARLKDFEAAARNSKSSWSDLQRLSDHVIVAMKLAPGDHCELIANSKGTAGEETGERELTIAVKLFYHEMAGHAVDIARDTGSEVSGSGTRASHSTSAGAAGISFQSNSLGPSRNKTSSYSLSSL